MGLPGSCPEEDIAGTTTMSNYICIIDIGAVRNCVHIYRLVLSL